MQIKASKLQLILVAAGVTLGPSSSCYAAPAGQTLQPKTAPVSTSVKEPPVALPIKKAVPATATAAQTAQVQELERLMFGDSKPNIPLEYRLDRLESEVFHSTHPDWDATKRIERLTQTLVGSGGTAPQTSPTQTSTMPYPPNQVVDPYGAALPYPSGDPYGYGYDPNAAQSTAQPGSTQPQQRSLAMPPAPDLDSPEFTKELPRLEAEKFALDEVNEIRTYNARPPLAWDDTAYKVASIHVNDLAERNTISHNNAHGENPDVRYTKAGGTDAVLESLISMKASGRVPLTKSLVYQVIKELTNAQDDRDALLSPYATKFAFSLANGSKQNKVIACSEIVTDIAELEPIPTDVRVGDKVEIKGTIKGPYHFQKITLAWEGFSGAIPDEEEQDEALPYFPPLDYTAYARKTEHDWEKAQRLLQLGGIGLALAGGLFIPPVALAAPLIASTGNTMKVKPVSDIPIKGGVKVSGQSFEHKPVISKDNKEGIYYITVWAQSDTDPNPIAVSRRAIFARSGDSSNNVSSNPNSDPKVDRDLLTKGGHETK